MGAGAMREVELYRYLLGLAAPRTVWLLYICTDRDRGRLALMRPDVLDRHAPLRV